MEGPRVLDTAGAGVGREAVSGNQGLGEEAGFDGREQLCPGEPGVGVDQRASLGDRCSMSSAGGSQKKRNAVVRKELADTQECEACLAERLGEQRRGQGGDELRSKCAKRYGWMVRTQVHE